MVKVKRLTSSAKKIHKTSKKGKNNVLKKKTVIAPKHTKIKQHIEDEFSDSDNDEFLQEDLSAGHQAILENSEAEDSDNSASELDEAKHKADLQKLKQSDPDFYKFLEENDRKLLNFSVSDDEADEDGEDEEVHKPIGDLDVASDESDFEPDSETPTRKDDKVITLKMIKRWQSEIEKSKNNKTIIVEVIQAFHAALKTISNDAKDDDESVHFIVEGSAIFNAVIQLCVMHLGPAIRKFLGIQPGSKQPPHKCKKFSKINKSLKNYFTDLLKLLVGVSSSNIQTILLKHLHYMASMLNSFTTITKSILVKLIKLWGTAEDSVRVLAFFCILRIVNNQMPGTFDICLKSMYMTYVKNSKFVSINSLAPINFMKRSLVEMYSLDLNVSYSHVFLYIRQLAIHLRNAIIDNKKENIQAVYNWQFINSLRLWGSLLSVTNSKPQMQQLVYPFIQVCLGTLKLVPTAQYYPLRFHVIQILIDFTKDTGTYIPILPFILEVLTSFDFDKKHQRVSMKPLHFTSLLRLSKSQMQENGFKDTVIDMIYGQLLEYLTAMSHTISFPDLSLLCVIQIKQFLKKCKSANYTRKMKQVLEKIQQNNQFIEKERSKLTITLTNLKQIEGWESQIKVKGTPLATYYESWSKIRDMKKNKEITNNDVLGDYNFPKLKKHKKDVKKDDDDEESVELFPSDSEDEELSVEKKQMRGKRGGKNVKKKVPSTPSLDTEEMDIVQDITADDW